MDATTKSPGLAQSFLERHAVTFKMAWVIFLVLVLLIPLGMIRSILQERMGRRNEAVAGITAAWGARKS
jgi:inner membrane protein